jgi:Na+/proline symporter
MEPGLTGFDNEGAYMLVSKAVLPAGLLGLMLSAMVFATASSLNTVLNISAAVFTNDVYAQINKKASQHHLLNVGRVSTAVLGVAAVLSAFMVQYFGGIVNMVLSLSAIIGGSLFMPPIWAIFSRRQTAFSILTVTLVSLGANILLNLAPDLLGITLDRASQMLFGVFFPMSLLILFEAWYALRKAEDPRLSEYRAIQAERRERKKASIEESLEEHVDSRSNNIISASIAVVGLMIIGLGLIADVGTLVVSATGVVIILAAALLNQRVRSRLS